MATPIPLDGAKLAIRASLSAGLALAAAGQAGLPHPIYAMLAAVIVTDLSPPQARLLGLRRIVATVVGAGTGALLTPVLPAGPFTVALAILVAMLLCIALRARDAVKVAGYTCGIVVLAHGEDHWRYASWRLVETVLGIGVAWLVSLVPALVPSGPSARKEGA